MLNILRGYADPSASAAKRAPNRFVKNAAPVATPFAQTYALEGARPSRFVRNADAAPVEAARRPVGDHAFNSVKLSDWTSLFKRR